VDIKIGYKPPPKPVVTESKPANGAKTNGAPKMTNGSSKPAGGYVPPHNRKKVAVKSDDWFGDD